MFPVDEPSILTCSCGTAWCGKCGNEPHWPASCEAAEMQSLEYIGMKKSELIIFCSFKNHLFGIYFSAMSLKSSNTAARYTKECPQCHKTIERKNVRRYGNVCPNCSHQFHCWKCVGECQDDHLSRMRCSMRYYRWYDRPCKREEVPETVTFIK